MLLKSCLFSFAFVQVKTLSLPHDFKWPGETMPHGYVYALCVLKQDF